MLHGVYRCHANGEPSFTEAGAPADDALHALLQTIAARLTRMPARQGALLAHMGQTYRAEPGADAVETRAR